MGKEDDTVKSPCCNVEAWDMDCDECEGDGEGEDDFCYECGGLGYIENWYECPKCGNTFEVMQ